MESVTDAVDGAVPRLQQIRMGQGLFATVENLGLLFAGQFVSGIRFVKKLGAMLFKPSSELPSVFPGECQDGGFELFQTHGRQSSSPPGPLQDNGGPTWTHALRPGRPALDAGRSGGLSTDQRGGARAVLSNTNTLPGDGSDIGAFESGGYVRLTSLTRTKSNVFGVREV